MLAVLAPPTLAGLLAHSDHSAPTITRPLPARLISACIIVGSSAGGSISMVVSKPKACLEPSQSRHRVLVEHAGGKRHGILLR